MPIFRVKSVKNANFFCVNSVKIYMGAARGARDKYEVCFYGWEVMHNSV